MVILGLAGFAAGFLGPMIFVPEANQGPLVGIFISGPAGFALGAILWGLCSLAGVAAQNQWRLLCAVTAIGVLSTLLAVQPQPALQGYVFEGEVQSCESVQSAEASVLSHWDAQVAKYTYAEPRAGWREDMHSQLLEAPGVLVMVRIQRKNPIFENRKPWNRGEQFASGWAPQSEETPFYDASSHCSRYGEGSALRGYQAHDADDVLAHASVWPPDTLLRILSASKIADVPPRWATL